MTEQSTAGQGREYWATVLTAGGATAIPRWTLAPAPGTATVTTPVPADLAAAATRVAAELAVPLSGLLLAAHAAALAALSGEADVVTGYVTGGTVLPLRLSTAPPTWRGLATAAGRAEAALLAHRDVAVEALRAELGVAGPVAETTFHAGGEPVGDVPLAIGVTVAPAIALRYRTDVLDADAAARIAGYHLTALTLLTADLDAEHRRQHLLSPAEHTLQVEGLAGPDRPLPDLRVHELFERRVAAHPDAVAAVQGERSWTYAELNARANQLGRALLARGLGRQDVVAVATERNLDWLAAVLAVFKAGGVYLPLEPRFPADRIATTLRRAQCSLVLTETGSTTSVDKALDLVSGADRLLVDDAYAEGHDSGDLGVAVEADQAAYVYFTSGSTGEPKGAMCEHAGMLNHLLAKIDDLGVAEGGVVAQIAPQCFDISLWQLVSALLVGGRTLLVGQEVILDVDRFVDTIVDGRVAVLQVVPSYLEVVLSYLEATPRELPDLRCVSVTGEAVKKELVQRWFDGGRTIPMVNAYGLTETSDDTNHEVMTEVPATERVPLGAPIPNVTVYVLDENLQPVPLGAPGEIAFSGVCVGRGYVNDPERTRAVFMADPHRPGERLYLAGDFGRWLPDGKLEFLGRRDSQVKIRGFRIEIGEIENTLLRAPGVRDGAVVVDGEQLVAFYAADGPLPADGLRDRLAQSLPHYMVPAAYHHLEKLPLTANSKIDKKALAALAGRLEGAEEQASEAPVTPTEQRVAAAFAKVLGVDAAQVGRRDNFFERGGSSLSAVKLAIALDRAVSLKDIIRNPVLADLAALLDTPAV